MADRIGEVSEPRAGVDRAALSTLPFACLIHAGSIRTQVHQVEKPTEGKILKKKEGLTASSFAEAMEDGENTTDFL